MNRIRKVRHTAKTVTVAAKLLFAVRSALPWWLRWLAAITVAVKVITAPLPVDGGVDELLMAITLSLLWWQRRMLVKACWHEAKYLTAEA